MRSQTLWEAFSYIDDWYLDIADAPAKETLEMRKETKHFSARKTFTVLLAAIICVSLLAVTAAATGWIPGLFNMLKEKYPQDEELFEAAAQANTDAVPEFLEIPHLDLSKLVLMERYFDGETILIGYDLDTVLPEPVVGIEPEEALLKEIKKGSRMSQIWNDSYTFCEESATENAIKYDLLQDAFQMDRLLKGTLSEEAYQKAWKLLEDQGYVCIAVREVWLGDHILINGRDIVEDYLAENAYADRTDYTSELGNCIRLEPLPEAVKTQETVTVALTIRSSVQYWYMDLKGNGRVYTDSDSVESNQVSFELERSEKNG